MKKMLAVLLMTAIGAGIAFAQFEIKTGLYGGYGTIGANGLNVQVGYGFPLYNDKFDKFIFVFLADLGIGYRYGNNEVNNYIKDQYKDSFNLDYFFGLAAEFYFLPFMGIGAGFGLTKCPCGSSEGINPYIRAEVPFVFEFIKTGVYFDYVFYLKDHKEAPPGYRVNLFVNLSIMELINKKRNVYL